MSQNNKKKRGVFDIETNGLLDTVTQVWCVVVKDIDTGDRYVWELDNIHKCFSVLDTFDTLIGHNIIAFDFPVLRKLYGWDYAGTKIDTLIMSRTQRPNRQTPKGSTARPHSVEAWSYRLDGQRKVENEVWDHYHPTILHRCLADVEIQANIYQALLEEGKEEGWELAHRLNMKLFDLLQRQEEYGWYIDQEKLEDNLRVLHRWIDRIDRVVTPYLPVVVENLGELRNVFKKNGMYSQAAIKYMGSDVKLLHGPFTRVGFRLVDLDSSVELKDFLLSLGWKPKEYNKDAQGNRRSPKFSKDDPFDGLNTTLGQLIAKRIQCKQRIGILNGWKAAIRADGRIGAKVAGIASTGRIRHSGIVNVPSPHSKAFFAKQMRAVFSATPGFVLVGVDSKGNQVRQLAARMGDEEFTNAVLFGTAEDGTDLHSLNQRRSGAPSRSKAKNFFYGFIFGAGANKIATTLGITTSRAKELISTYLNELPKLRSLIKRLTDEWRITAKRSWNAQRQCFVYRDGFIKGIDGRPIQVDSEHKILCYALQSDEAIQMGAAYVRFHQQMEKAGYKLGQDFGTLIWVHDEWQFETRPEIAEQAVKIGCEAIAWAGKFYNIRCPHEGDWKIGYNWSQTH